MPGRGTPPVHKPMHWASSININDISINDFICTKYWIKQTKSTGYLFPPLFAIISCLCYFKVDPRFLEHQPVSRPQSQLNSEEPFCLQTKAGIRQQGKQKNKKHVLILALSFISCMSFGTSASVFLPTKWD
uniref:Uncharacterized protein n=1 Tax=Myotis myotis TaxID=51298 RepID=A0A7J7UPK8_MYOMY|nr:hypothetical protein mMyoMyo1_008627 [Myotis myotis]